MKIENLLGHKFKADETVTLQLLESLQVFNYPAELMEVSGQASSEAALEALLRKVCSATILFLNALTVGQVTIIYTRLKIHGKHWSL